MKVLYKYIICTILIGLFGYWTIKSTSKEQLLKEVLELIKEDTAGVLTLTTGRKIFYSQSDSSSFMDNPNYIAGRGLGRNTLTFYADSNTVMYGKRYGVFSNKFVKEWDTIFTPSSALGFSVNFSHVGYTSAPLIYVSAERNTGTAYLSPQISIATRSATTATFNLTEGNNNVLSALGITFLSGPGISAAQTPSAITVHVSTKGY